MTVRLLFVGHKRLADALITLHYDRFTHPEIDKTIVYHYDESELVQAEFKKYFNLDKFEFVHDTDLIEQIKLNYFDEYQIIKTYPVWIRQQFYKLFALDFCDADQIIIADSDSFRIKHHNSFENNIPVLYVMRNDTPLTPENWGNTFEQLTGYKQSPHIFISEFMPVLKSDWQSFKQHIAAHCQNSWCKSIIDAVHSSTEGFVLSEYQLLGNWMLHSRPNTKLVDHYKMPLGITGGDIELELNEDISRFVCINLCVFGPSDWDLDKNSITTFISLTDVDRYVKLIDEALLKGSQNAD